MSEAVDMSLGAPISPFTLVDGSNNRQSFMLSELKPFGRYVYLQVSDDAMMPTVNHSDIVEVDISVHEPIQDGLYLLSWSDRPTILPIVRRFILRLCGDIRVSQDNPNYPNPFYDFQSLEELQKVYVIHGLVKRYWVESSRLTPCYKGGVSHV